VVKGSIVIRKDQGEEIVTIGTRPIDLTQPVASPRN
jgi:hypothetical protein